MKDVIIIGAGVIGASIARTLAKYNLDVLVLEKENDVGDGASGANSAILHSGYDPDVGSLKAKYNVIGNPMFDTLCRDLDVKMFRNGSITLALTDEDVIAIDGLVERAKLNQVPVEIWSKETIQKHVPNLHPDVKLGLYAPTAGIINPFELVVALMENAVDNGVQLILNAEVKAIKRINGGFLVSTVEDNYTTKYIINAAGVYADVINDMVNEPFFTIRPRRGEYLILDHFDDNFLKHTLFSVPTSKGKGVLLTPSTHYNYLLGPTSYFVENKDDVSTNQETIAEVKVKANQMLVDIPYHHMIKQFAGNRAVSNTNDFIIEETTQGFINVAGIQSPGLVASPAIAQEVEIILSKSITLHPKSNYNQTRRPVIRLHDVSIDKRLALIKENPSFGRIICRCEQISEGEVIDCIHRNVGATTIKGVKKRVRPGFGRCQGGFCEPLVMRIIAKECHIPLEKVEYGKKGSYIITGATKEKQNAKR